MLNLALLEEYNPWWRDPTRRVARAWKVHRVRFAEIVDRLADRADRRALLLLGPRQVGKTVLLRQTADTLLDRGVPGRNIVLFDLSDDRAGEAGSLRELVDQGRRLALDGWPTYFLLDEIQGARDGWSVALRQLIDEHRRLPDGSAADRFVLTGSAATALRSEQRESGLGRWDELRVEGLTWREALEVQGLPIPDDPGDFSAQDLERYLERGGFPEHLWNESPRRAQERLRVDIVDRALLRDLLRTGVDLERVRRLFVELVQGSGNEITLKNLVADLGGDLRTLERNLELLLDTQLVVRLEAHSSSSKRRQRLQQSFKIYAADHGLISAFSIHRERPGASSPRARVFEAAVYRHLREIVGNPREDITWLPSSDVAEIDFLVRTRSGDLVAVEVTSASEPEADKVRRLLEAGRRVGARRHLIVTDGVIEERRADVTLLPLPLMMLRPERALEAS